MPPAAPGYPCKRLRLQLLERLRHLSGQFCPLGSQKNVKGPAVPMQSPALNQLLFLHAVEHRGQCGCLNVAGPGNLDLTGPVVSGQILQHFGLSDGQPGVPELCQQPLMQDGLAGHEQIMKGFFHPLVSFLLFPLEN